MQLERQIADVYFDKQDSEYRLVVEYFQVDPFTKSMVVPVTFAGTASETFLNLQTKAYEEAEKRLKSVLDFKF